MRRHIDLVKEINLIPPVQPYLQKFFAFRFARNTFITSVVLFPLEGRIAIVTDVGSGMRWTRAALLTRAFFADGEVVWCRCRRFEVPTEVTVST